MLFRSGEKKITTPSEIIFLLLGALLGLAYGFLVEEEEKDLATNIILAVPAGAIGGLLFGYLVDMISVLIEAIFNTSTAIIKKTVPPILIITFLATAIFLVIWAYTKQFGPIGSITFEQMDIWLEKILDVIKTFYNGSLAKLFNAIGDLFNKLWEFLLNN